MAYKDSTERAAARTQTKITGMVRWYRGDKIGIKLNLSSNTAAQISSYYKHFR